MKRLLLIIALASISLFANAQDSIFRQRLEIAEVDDENDDNTLEVFRMQDNGRYYLSVGHLGVGGDVVQIQFDPIFELFIPLGETLAEALETMKTLNGWYKMSRKETKYTEGCLSAAYPNDKFESVLVTRRQFLATRVLEFGLDRDGYVRAAHISKADFSSLYTSLRLYKKLHPKEL